MRRGLEAVLGVVAVTCGRRVALRRMRGARGTRRGRRRRPGDRGTPRSRSSRRSRSRLSSGPVARWRRPDTRRWRPACSLGSRRCGSARARPSSEGDVLVVLDARDLRARVGEAEEALALGRRRASIWRSASTRVQKSSFAPAWRPSDGSTRRPPRFGPPAPTWRVGREALERGENGGLLRRDPVAR